MIAAVTAVEVTVLDTLVVCDEVALLLTDVVAELDCEVVAELVKVDEPVFDCVVVALELCEVVADDDADDDADDV